LESFLNKGKKFGNFCGINLIALNYCVQIQFSTDSTSTSTYSLFDMSGLSY